MKFKFAQLVIVFIYAGNLLVTLGQNDSLYSSLLSEFIMDGKVRYSGLCEDGELNSYISSLNEVKTENFIDHRFELAFWINVYNSYTLKIVCDNYPVESIVDIGWGGLVLGHVFSTTVWDEELVKIGSLELSLNEIEHDIIRKKFKEPRIHFALVCASLSCPPLLNTAFNAENLDQQLDEQAKKFLNDSTKNSFDLSSRKAYLSRIFDWYESDFAENEQKLLLYLSGYLPDEIGNDIRENIGLWAVEYLDYNWSLNDIR